MISNRHEINHFYESIKGQVKAVKLRTFFQSKSIWVFNKISNTMSCKYFILLASKIPFFNHKQYDKVRDSGTTVWLNIF